MARPSLAAGDAVLVGAGDIADCRDGPPEHIHAADTARLLDDIAGTVFTAGDNAYPDGTAANYRDCYDPTWGRHKARTRPAPGNHEYNSGGAAYYAYFGAAAGPSGKGYYSYDLGAWHIVSLNSEIDAGANSTQAQWLDADLAAHRTACTLAYWHKPVFSSGEHGNISTMRSIFAILYQYNADVVINGHDHDYERFAPQDPNGKADTGGIREFVVGTGGAHQRSFGTIRSNSEKHATNAWGVLKLTLHPTSYDWEFVPIPGVSFRDSGSAACVSNGPPQATATSVPPEPTPASPPTPPPTPRPGRTVRTPIADAYVRGGPYANQNFGGEQVLIIKDGSASDATYDRRSFLRFDLSQLSRVSNATLRLTLAPDHPFPNGSPAHLALYAVNDDTWQERQVTWRNQPRLGTRLHSIAVTSNMRTLQFDVTPFVSQHLAGDHLVSFALVDDTVANRMIRLSSREGAAPPVLELTP